MDVGGALFGTLAGLFGVVGTYMGWLTWRGVEYRWVGEALADPQHRRTLIMGGRTLYQTWFGVGAAMLAGGPGFALIGFGYAVVSVVAPGEEPWWWWTISVLAVVLILVAALYTLAYFWTGVPDGLRPVAQRGQPKPGRLDDDGRPGVLERLLDTPGPVDLGPDPTRPPWSRGDPEWTSYRPRPRPRRSSPWDDDPW